MSDSLGAFIRKLRKEKNLTQVQVAESSGLTRSYISRLEDDDFKSPSAIILIRLANGLGIPHDALFQVAGYVPKTDKSHLPEFDVYLRAKFGMSEKAIKEIETMKEYLEQKYKS